MSLDQGVEEAPGTVGARRGGHSPNWSGTSIAATDALMFTQVVGSWKEPKIARVGDSTHESRSSVWIGLNGQRAFDASALPQIGTTQLIEANAAAAKHYVWFEWWANTKKTDENIPRRVLPIYINRIFQPGHEVLCCIELVPRNPAIIPGNPPESLPTVARMCIKNETTHEFIMPFYVYPPMLRGAGVDVSGSTAEWVVERPDSLANPDFTLPKFIDSNGDRTPVTFADCVAALAADPGSPILAEATLNVSRRVSMIRRRPNQGLVEVIARTPRQRITDTSFSIDVDGG